MCTTEKRADCDFIHLLLSACYVPGTVLGTGNTKLNRAACSKGPYRVTRG